MSKFKFKVGDYVRVEDAGAAFSTYVGFFKANDIDYNIAVRYGYDIVMGELEDYEGHCYKVEAVGKHEKSDENLYVISDAPYSRCYLIGEKGLDFYDTREMTLEQVIEEAETAMGCHIQIVK